MEAEDDKQLNEQDKINELITELSECREDERNTQNQILEIINIIGTILGILFGASYLSTENKNKRFVQTQIFDNDWANKVMEPIIQIATPARIIFYLSVLSFSVAFLYITYLGIQNLLRYFYIQNIEDRLNDLFPDTNDNNNRGKFLHWNAFSAPILTKNRKHITTSHATLSFFTYAGAVSCVILFSIGLIISLFLDINPIKWYDKLLLYSMIFFMLLSFLLFARLTSKADEVAKFSWDMAHENQQIRLGKVNGKIYGKSQSFRRLLKYFIYPKIQDLQKPVLIALGFLYYFFYTGTKIKIGYVPRLIFVMFIFDFLAYQARYQINDIRGIKEDKEAGCKNRLISDDLDNEGHVIKLSFTLALLKILCSFLITLFFGKSEKWILLLSLVILFFLTLFYEISRAKNIIWLIFILVGVGYPLRFFLGFFVVSPKSFFSLIKLPLICYILAFWAYGSFSSILSWVNEVIDRLQRRYEQNDAEIFQDFFEKKHYLYIQGIIKERFVLAERHLFKGKVLPLREKNKLRDPWNIAFILSIFLLMIITFIIRFSLKYILIESAIFISFILNICLKQGQKLVGFGIGWILITMKIIMQIRDLSPSAEYVWFSLTQILITVTYLVLSYRPQFKKIKFKVIIKKLIKSIYIKVLGNYAIDMIKNADSSTRNSR